MHSSSNFISSCFLHTFSTFRIFRFLRVIASISLVSWRREPFASKRAVNKQKSQAEILENPAMLKNHEKNGGVTPPAIFQEKKTGGVILTVSPVMFSLLRLFCGGPAVVHAISSLFDYFSSFVRAGCLSPSDCRTICPPAPMVCSVARPMYILKSVDDERDSLLKVRMAIHNDDPDRYLFRDVTKRRFFL